MSRFNCDYLVDTSKETPALVKALKGIKNAFKPLNKEMVDGYLGGKNSKGSLIVIYNSSSLSKDNQVVEFKYSTNGNQKANLWVDEILSYKGSGSFVVSDMATIVGEGKCEILKEIRNSLNRDLKLKSPTFTNCDFNNPKDVELIKKVINSIDKSISFYSKKKKEKVL